METQGHGSLVHFCSGANVRHTESIGESGDKPARHQMVARLCGTINRKESLDLYALFRLIVPGIRHSHHSLTEQCCWHG